MFNKSDIGKIFTIKEITEGTPCKNCDFCLRLILLEMGLSINQKFKLKSHMHGLWKLDFLSDYGNTTSSIALRDEELQRVCVL